MKAIPKKGAAIIASNHLAVVDSLILPSLVWRKIWFIGKKEYFQTDTIGHRFQKWFFTSVSVYPVDRAGGKAAEDALNVGRAAIDAGNIFGIYPEGTRSQDGCLYKGRTGVAKLVLEKRVPLIPVAMIGTRDAQVPGKMLPKPIKCGAIFADAMDFAKYYESYDKALANDDFEAMRKVLRAVTDDIMMTLHSISGQTYIDMYASDAKKIIANGENIIDYANSHDIKVLPAIVPPIKGAHLQGPQVS